MSMASLSLPWLKYERESSLRTTVGGGLHEPAPANAVPTQCGAAPGAGGQDFKLDLRGG